MKIIKYLLCFLAFSAFVACGGKSTKKDKASTKKEASTSVFSKVKEAGKAVKNTRKAYSKAEELRENMQVLAEEEPISQATLKSWIPENVKNYKRVSYKTGELATMGITSAISTFKNEEDDSKTFTLEVHDGAGPGASVVGSVMMGLTMDKEEETEDSFSRTTERKGQRVAENQNDKAKVAEISFTESNRFYLRLKGKNMTVDELWNIAEAMNTKKLNN